jgi:TPR repeat protein
MKKQHDGMRAEKLYLRAMDIRYGNRRGLRLPILWHLALRGHPGAMIELAEWFSSSNSLQALGKPADNFSALGLYRRAYRKGDPIAAQHLALSCFNRNDLRGYRWWLNRAAKAGDEAAAAQLRHFETRLPQTAAREIGRHRPHQSRDEFW